MTSIGNIRHLTTLTFNILRYGSTTERVVLGTALLGAGFLTAQKLYNLASYLFSKRQPSVALPKPEINAQVIEAYGRELEQRFPIHDAQPPAPIVPNVQADAAAVQPHSLLANLFINGIALTEATQPKLAEALHAYNELRKRINGEENRFVFLTERYLLGNLPATLKWEENELTIPAHINQFFQKLRDKLGQVRLGLEHIKPSEMPIATAEFRSDSPKKIFSLGELYQIVKLQGPHILSPLEISLKKEKIQKAKQKLHESRLKIIQKTLSTLKTLFINDFIATFPEKHKELYILFGSSETLRFVVENTCWHALDRALESIEITFIPSKETQQNIRKIDLESNLVKVLADKVKQAQAQGFLLQILTDPNDDKAIQSLVTLLLGESISPERDSFIHMLQQPELEIEERFIHQELSRLKSIQQFYHALSMATAVAKKGKKALLAARRVAKFETITSKPTQPPPVDLLGSVRFPQNTYGQEVERVSIKVVQAAERAVTTISGQRWQMALASLNQELAKIAGLSGEAREEIVRQGWVDFNDKFRLIHLTGSQRWLLTKKMIIQRMALNSLQDKGTQLVQEVGKGAASFIKTLYGRLVTVLLAFDKRTEGATEADQKPADRIAKTLFDSLLQSYQALLRVQKDAQNVKRGSREDSVVKVLEKRSDFHTSASNKASADTVFLGKLILELLSILQPEGLSADIQKALRSALRQGGSMEPTIIRRAIEMYNRSIQPAVQPWVKPVGNFLLQALENIIERQSANSVASLLSEVLNPIKINAALIDLLKEDQSNIDLAPPSSSDREEPLKWHQADEDKIRSLLDRRSRQISEIDQLEKYLQATDKAKGDNKALVEELLPKKKDLAQLDMQLLPELLRRIVLANVPVTFAGYALQFAYDLFELIQYPRILRHVVFNVMEKTVQSLSSLDKDETAVLLAEPVNPVARQPLMDFIFSRQQKTHIGDTIATLFWNMSPAGASWSTWTLMAQGVARTFPLGYIIFSQIQSKVETLIAHKYSDPEAVKWSGAKLITWMDGKILQFAEDATDKGMTELIAQQLTKALEVKKI